MEKITVGQFICLVWEGYLLHQKNFSSQEVRINNEEYLMYVETSGNLDVERVLEYGWDKGWLEEQDILWKNQFIERRNVARIVHEFLRIQCGEADVNDWREAEKLTDLYHCKACAKHVAQVFLKGIMQAKEEKRFQLLLKIDELEAKEIVNRMFNEPKRVKKYTS